jgi:hypothetical protein
MIDLRAASEYSLSKYSTASETGRDLAFFIQRAQLLETH